MIRTAPPQAGQVSMSMPNMRFRRCVQVIAMDGMYAGFAGAKTGHGSAALRRRFLLFLIGYPGFGALAPRRLRHPRPVLAVAPKGHKGANTPWKRVRLTRGLGRAHPASKASVLGARAASRAMKSRGSKMTCVVPSRYGVFNW